MRCWASGPVYSLSDRFIDKTFVVSAISEGEDILLVHIMSKKLSEYTLADLTGRKVPFDDGTGGARGRWGLGPIDSDRREIKQAVALEIILKLHNTPPTKSKPVVGVVHHK